MGESASALLSCSAATVHGALLPCCTYTTNGAPWPCLANACCFRRTSVGPGDAGAKYEASYSISGSGERVDAPAVEYTGDEVCREWLPVVAKPLGGKPAAIGMAIENMPTMQLSTGQDNWLSERDTIMPVVYRVLQRPLPTNRLGSKETSMSLWWMTMSTASSSTSLWMHRTLV